MILPGPYAPASIALGVIRARKPPHPQHVLLREGGSPWGGLCYPSEPTLDKGRWITRPTLANDKKF